MSRQKRTSPILETAQHRLAGLRSITPAPDFGADLTISGFEAEINVVSEKVAAYNKLLSIVDQELNELEDLERPLGEKSGRFLAAVKGKYGPDSSEYEQVGGTRTSDRKRPGPRQPKLDAASPKVPTS